MIRDLFNDKSANENKYLCKKCKGKCCASCPCLVDAREINTSSSNAIVSDIKNKKFTIVPVLDENFYFQNEFYTFPYLYVRSATVYNNPVDLMSLNGKCIHLTKKGCEFSSKERPLGGRLLIPEKDGMCHYEDELVTHNIVLSFLPFQSDLTSAAELLTGSSIASDVETLVKSFSDRIFDDADPFFIKEIMYNFLNSYTYVKLSNEYGMHAYSPYAIDAIKKLLKRYPDKEDKIISYLKTHYNSKSIEICDLESIIERVI